MVRAGLWMQAMPSPLSVMLAATHSGGPPTNQAVARPPAIANSKPAVRSPRGPRRSTARPARGAVTIMMSALGKSTAPTASGAVPLSSVRKMGTRISPPNRPALAIPMTPQQAR